MKGCDIHSQNLLDRWRLFRNHARRSLSTLIDRQLPIPASSIHGSMCDNAQHLVKVAAFYKLLGYIVNGGVMKMTINNHNDDRPYEMSKLFEELLFPWAVVTADLLDIKLDSTLNSIICVGDCHPARRCVLRMLDQVVAWTKEIDENWCRWRLQY